jgi:thioredoxin-like negative regulator of GroEL
MTTEWTDEGAALYRAVRYEQEPEDARLTVERLLVERNQLRRLLDSILDTHYHDAGHDTYHAIIAALNELDPAFVSPAKDALQSARRQTDAPDHDEPNTPAPQPPVNAPHAHGV